VPEHALLFHQRSVFYFAALLAASLPAFWPSYFAAPRVEADWHVHVHGVAMFLWLALLVAQGALIRAGNRAAHRKLGKASFVLVPVNVLSSLLLIHFRLQKGLNDELLYFFWVILSLVTLFAFSFAMAMRYRRQPMLHARYMACTALALIDPIFARLFAIHLGVEPPLMQVMTYLLVDGILVLLAYADWRDARPPVFARMLGLFVLAQAPTFFIYQVAWWKSFVQWYAALPLP
jgi:hypothetical protein